MPNWYTVATPDETDRLVLAWPDAPIENMEVLGFILSTSRDQVLEYAPAVAVPYEVDGVPENLVFAQLQQATNLWNAGRVTTGGEVGMESFSYTPRPLDKTVKSIIRPSTGRPRVR